MNTDTICAIATPAGSGAIAVIRLSGENSIEVVDEIFFSKNPQKKLISQKTNTVHLGILKDKNEIIDEVLVTIFRKPNSYTGENIVEISCHGSMFVQQKILQLIINQGVRLAKAGEFTLRSFLNGKMDLSQAEAVADIIAANSESMHKTALSQMRGGFTNEIKILRTQLLDFISLIELELDFSEEDVEFVNRKQLKTLLLDIQRVISKLLNSFAAGNVIKNGIPTAIIGDANVGKSTLLNALLNEEKAIVSDIAGTTRDAIEDSISLEGLTFRFIDTAGLRETNDKIENLGIQKTLQNIEKARIILYLLDATNFENGKQKLLPLLEQYFDKKWIIVVNKIDKIENFNFSIFENFEKSVKTVFLSAKYRNGIENLIKILVETVNVDVKIAANEVVVTNIRHYEALSRAFESLNRALNGLETKIPTDFVSQDIREVLFYLGEITGEITTNEILGNIFAKFCIGK